MAGDRLGHRALGKVRLAVSGKVRSGCLKY